MLAYILDVVCMLVGMMMRKCGVYVTFDDDVYAYVDVDADMNMNVYVDMYMNDEGNMNGNT